MALKRTTVYLKDEVIELWRDVSFLTKISKTDLINDSLIDYLQKIVKEQELEEKLKVLKK